MGDISDRVGFLVRILLCFVLSIKNHARFCDFIDKICKKFCNLEGTAEHLLRKLLFYHFGFFYIYHLE